jgi:hypothetical protein
VDGTFFDFAFFLRLSHVAGNRGDVEGAQELQELLIEAHQQFSFWPAKGLKLPIGTDMVKVVISIGPRR